MIRIITIVTFCTLLCCTDNRTRTEASAKPILDDTNSLPSGSENKRHWDPHFVIGKFNPEEDSNFVEVNIEHADREGMFLHKETYASFKKMFKSAMEEGVDLEIRSATRNFETQKSIWEAKWNGKRTLEAGTIATEIASPKERALQILKYSSMPGTSRHHWGTDIDLNAFTNDYFEEGPGLKVYKWLTANASEYGFCQPYTAKGIERPNGYEEEKWHWSYIPISSDITRWAGDNLSDEMISGFEGSDQAQAIQIIDRYVLGIDSSCLR